MADTPGIRYTDIKLMRRALDLASRSTEVVSPNPMVGAVVVDSDGKIVGEGTTVSSRHAEPEALDAAGEAARDGTIYVTLEPCRHHGNTPPCTEAVIASGVRRVVVAQPDPDPRVAGEGVEDLKRAGLEVEVGLLEEEARRQLEAYRHHRSRGRPFVLVKIAVTADGRTAAPDGSSMWITGEQAREDAHGLRRASDAVVVGSGTVLTDDPRLTVRKEPLPSRQPRRVVLDRTGRVPGNSALFGAEGEAIVYTRTAAPERIAEWKSAGASVAVISGEESQFLDAVISDLDERGALEIMIEGGPTVAGEFVRSGRFDRLVVYVGAALAGGDDAKPAFAGPAHPTIGEFTRLRLEGVTRLGDDVRLDYRPHT